LLIDVSEVRAASIITLMMEAARQYSPEDKAELHTCRRENLKSHTVNNLVAMVTMVSKQS
jgi:hypothetical protein